MFLTNNHDQNTNQNGLASTKVLSNETGNDSSDETSNLIDCHNKSDQVCAFVCRGIDVKGFSKGGTVDEATHQAIVEADKEETKTCQGGDCVEKGIALELNGHDEERLSCRSVDLKLGVALNGEASGYIDQIKARPRPIYCGSSVIRSSVCGASQI